jgi:glucose/arabinose dehydrogenase
MSERSLTRRGRARPVPALARAVVACLPLGLVAACSPLPQPSSTPSATSITSAVPSPAASVQESVPVSTSAPPATTQPPSPLASAAPSPAPSASAGAGRFDPTGLELKTDEVVDGLDSPVDITSARDGTGRLFVVEQAGRIRIIKDGKSVATPFLDIVDRIASGGERGLLGLAFHPDYPKDPRIFVDYTDLNGDTNISEFSVPTGTPDKADPATERVLLHVKQPFANHNGGGVVFGNDGMLYIAFGDGGSADDPLGNGQNLNALLAKILRIDVGKPGAAAPYTVPPDNPFVGQANAKPEIWLAGMRNPWRLRFDRPTGDLWIGDVGQNAWEEIDVARAGQGGLNYGWNVMEGFHCFSPQLNCDETGLTLPVAEYAHDAGCAVIGGVVVHDPKQPRMDGGYIFSDSCSGTLWMLDPVADADGKSPATIVGQTGVSVSSINDDEDGTVYLTDLEAGRVLKVSAKD